jgi:hypothetical protein
MDAFLGRGGGFDMKTSRSAARRWALVTLAAVLLLPAAARATPTFLSPVDVSDAGQDAYAPQVAEDPSGNSLMVWTRFDGTNTRIQARFRAANGTWDPTATISTEGRDAYEPQLAFDPSGNATAVWSQFDGAHARTHAALRPAGGSFGGDQTISPGGRDAVAPQISVDSTGKAIAVWYAFDGTTDRIQAAVRPAGGTFGSPQTLSAAGVEAYEPQIATGPNADANAAAVWTGSDGANTRVQSSRRRDVTGYPRPKGASPTRIALVPAYQRCTSSNRMHGASLSFPSCAAPQMSSSVLTVGTPDANGFGANFSGFVGYTVVNGDPATSSDEADVRLVVSLTDIRNRPSGSDYVGRVLATANVQITDQNNAAETPEPGTLQSFNHEFPVDCVATALTTIGSSCTLNTTADALIPGTVLESKRTIWEIGQVSIKDAGPNGTGYASCPPTCGDGDESTFLREGVFVP